MQLYLDTRKVVTRIFYILKVLFTVECVFNKFTATHFYALVIFVIVIFTLYLATIRVLSHYLQNARLFRASCLINMRHHASLNISVVCGRRISTLRWFRTGTKRALWPEPSGIEEERESERAGEGLENIYQQPGKNGSNAEIFPR